LATASALSVTAFAATVGLGANFGLFGITEPNSSVGRLDSKQSAVTTAASAPAPRPHHGSDRGADD
jgi:hypothetical protein